MVDYLSMPGIILPFLAMGSIRFLGEKGTTRLRSEIVITGYQNEGIITKTCSGADVVSSVKGTGDKGRLSPLFQVKSGLAKGMGGICRDLGPKRS